METCMEKIKTASKRPEKDQNLLVSSLQSSNGSVAVQRGGHQQQCDQLFHPAFSFFTPVSFCFVNFATYDQPVYLWCFF